MKKKNNMKKDRNNWRMRMENDIYMGRFQSEQDRDKTHPKKYYYLYIHVEREG